MPWADASTREQERLAARLRGELLDRLLLGEHDPILTLGRRSRPGDAGGALLPTVAIEREGEAKYRGPGQLVAYPGLVLPGGRRDLQR